MDTELLIRGAALVAILSTGVVYGTDMFCAMVLRPAMARLDDHTLVMTTGQIHRFGDRRMPVPGVIGIVATATSAVTAALAAQWVQAIAAAIALGALMVWLVVYARLSAPINRQLTAAAESRRTLTNGRALQAKWDSVINARAALQGVAVAASCVVLMA